VAGIPRATHSRNDYPELPSAEQALTVCEDVLSRERETSELPEMSILCESMGVLTERSFDEEEEKR